MARTAEAYRTLQQDLNLALDHVTAQHAEVQKTMERAEADFAPSDPIAWAAVGFTLHNLYNAIENYFLRIAKFFENQIEGHSWHRDLVNRMGHEVPSLRPALLDNDTLEPFHELRSFRHTFRSLYDRKLDPRRVRIAAEHAEPACIALAAGHKQFVHKLELIADELERD